MSDNVCSEILVDVSFKVDPDSNEMYVETVFVVDSIFFEFVVVMAFILSVADIVEYLSEILMSDSVCSDIWVGNACKVVPDSNEMNAETVFVVDSIFVVFVVEMAFIFSVADIVEYFTEILMSDNVCSEILVDDACKVDPDSKEMFVETVFVVDSIFVVFVVEMAFIFWVADIV